MSIFNKNTIKSKAKKKIKSKAKKVAKSKIKKVKKNISSETYKKLLALLIIVALGYFTYLDGIEPTQNTTVNKEYLANTVISDEIAELYFINVGQGDANLIVFGEDTILIDGGTNSSADDLIEFLESINVTQIDLIIATHPHEDHIGGLDVVMNNIEVDQILMTDLPYNTKTYEDVVTAIDANNVELIYPTQKDIFEFESGLVLDIFLPSEEFESSNVNDDSIVCVAKVYDTLILYTGDMEEDLEEELMPQFFDIDILKVGHHGSKTSTTDEFLEKVSPELAIISCGIANKYGHPHIETIEKLTEMGTEIRRTDLEGTILIEIQPVA